MTASFLTKEKRPLLGALFLSTLLLLAPAILNGFPFIFPDSADYLVFTPRLYRAPYYAVFAFLFHMNSWIWGTIIAHAAITSHLLWTTLKLQKPNASLKLFLGLSLFLSTLSSLPYFVGFIMADIFTPIMFLIMFITAFHFDKLSKSLKIYLFFLACVATVSHIANLTMAIALLPLLIILMRYAGLKWTSIKTRLTFMAIPMTLTAAAILLYNAVIWSSLSLTPAGQTFFMANLIHHGPARTYLQKACPEAGYKICAYVDALPDTADKLLWSSGILEKLGGFEGMKDESKIIVQETIKENPAAILEMAFKNFLEGLQTRAPAAAFKADFQTTSTITLFNKKFGESTTQAYLNSAEMKNTLPTDVVKQIDDITLPLFLILMLALGARAHFRKNKADAAFAFYVLCCIAGNTLICTTLSGIHNRYQARVTWLIPLVVFLLIIKEKKKT